MANDGDKNGEKDGEIPLADDGGEMIFFIHILDLKVDLQNK